MTTPTGGLGAPCVVQVGPDRLPHETEGGYAARVKRASFADMNCSVAQSLDQVGEWWTLLIVRDALFGVTRFDDFRTRLGIARNMLTSRLDHLVAVGVLERVPYDLGRQRYDYVLTAKGRALAPVLSALREWGDAWICGADREPVVVTHRGCGGRVRQVDCCDRCGQQIDLVDMATQPGPGLRDPELLAHVSGPR